MGIYYNLPIYTLFQVDVKVYYYMLLSVASDLFVKYALCS